MRGTTRRPPRTNCARRSKAQRLLDAGHAVTAWNRSPGPGDALRARGATIAARIEDTLIANYRYAAEELGKAGIKALVEPLNDRDIPGTYVTRADQALDLIDRAGHANLGLLHDLYHAQIMVGDLLPNLEKLMPRIGHIQFADPPKRTEPGTGELNWSVLFAAIDRLGYRGWVSAEYFPTGKTADSLTWMR